MIKHIVRILLTLGLVYMVWREAGPWTATFCFISALRAEASAWMWRKVVPGLASLRAQRKPVDVAAGRRPLA